MDSLLKLLGISFAFCLASWAEEPILGRNFLDIQRCPHLLIHAASDPRIGFSHYVHFDPSSGFVYKNDVRDEIPDMEFANWVFQSSGARLYRANLPLESITGAQLLASNPSEPFSDAFLSRLQANSRVTVFKYIDGVHLLLGSVVDSQPVVKRNFEEIARLVSAEAENIYNWVQREKPDYKGHPVRAIRWIDTESFETRNFGLPLSSLAESPAVFRFEAGPKESGEPIHFVIGFGDINEIYYQGKVHLIDPH